MSVTIKVMTFNLRIPSANDGENQFVYRQDKIIKTVQSERPDVIGFQEAANVSFDLLRDRLTDYYVLGFGRNQNYRGEGIPVAFRKDTFSLCGFRQEWLSLTPQTPASLLTGLDQSRCPRVYSCTELLHRESDTPFAFYNVHSDHVGELARVAEATILMRDVAASPYRFILTGDFNALPDSASIKQILSTSELLGTVDATANIKGSFHGFSEAGTGTHKIDYIFTNLPTNEAESYAVMDDHEGGLFYSDHYALCAFVEI